MGGAKTWAYARRLALKKITQFVKPHGQPVYLGMEMIFMRTWEANLSISLPFSSRSRAHMLSMEGSRSAGTCLRPLESPYLLRKSGRTSNFPGKFPESEIGRTCKFPKEFPETPTTSVQLKIHNPP